jgi:putative ABC transport system permease protein
MGGWFAASLAVSLVLLAAFGKLLLSGLRIALTRLPRKPPPSVRHGLANLYRPGNQGAFVLAAMALGVMFTLTVFLLQRSMISEMFRSAPRGMPNVFLINVTQRERAGLLDLLHKQPGLESQPWLVAAIPARLDAVNGIPPPRDRGNRGSRYSQTRVSWAAEKPEQTEILRGAWWNPRTVKQPQVSISEDVAANLAIEPGARLDFTSYGRKLSAEVTSVHRTDPGRPSLEFVFSPGVLDGLPANYFGGLRVRPKDVPYLQREAWKRYPTVTVINAADVLEIIQDVVDHIALIVRFVSFFAIFAGMVVLASSVAGTRFRRIREVAILKSLGATRRRIAGIFSIEFLVLGAVAGLMGSILASAFSSLVLKRFFDTTFRFDAVPNLLGIVTTAILATIAGWIAGYRLLREKPLAVLRHE